MGSIILSSRQIAQPSNARASDLALSNGCGALLLPTNAGWSDSINMLSVTGAVGSPTTVADTSGVARSYAATADFFQDGGVLDPTGGYAWIMHCALTSSGGNWGGFIARTRDNATTAGWGWQKDNSGNLAVYHGSTNRYSFGSAAPLIDGLPHTFLGLWRSDTKEVELWRDGALFWSGSLTTIPDYWAGQGQIKLFSSRDTATFTGTASMAGLFTGNMDQATASELTANPWQLFGGKRVLYFDVVAGGLNLAASTSSASGATGQSTIAIQPSASVSNQANTSAALTVATALTATTASGDSASAVLAVATALQATVSSADSTTSQDTIAVPLTASVSNHASNVSAASNAGTASIASSVANHATSSATLTIGTALQATVAAQPGSAPVLSIPSVLSANAQSAGSSSAVLTLGISINVAIANKALAQAGLGIALPLTADVSNYASSSALLSIGPSVPTGILDADCRWTISPRGTVWRMAARPDYTHVTQRGTVWRV